MSATFTLTLDTTAPQGVALALDDGAAVTTSVDVLLGLSTTDEDTGGYTMKVWGPGIDESYDPAIQQDEAASAWITYDPAKVIRLTSGDGSKSVSARVRDDVHNVSGPVADTITLDTTAPVATITAAFTPARISKQPTKDTSIGTFTSDSAIQAWKVKVVPDANATHTQGTQIPDAGGSVNVTGGAADAEEPITVEVRGADLEAAGAEGDNTVKVFVQEAGSGTWSV
jgi:hypothetical protein